jgi:KUP system potassium uptake protein
MIGIRRRRTIGALTTHLLKGRPLLQSRRGEGRIGPVPNVDPPSRGCLAAAAGLDDASYFLSTIEPTVGTAPGMARWRKRLFVATAAGTADAANYFGLPRDRTVILGTRIEV